MSQTVALNHTKKITKKTIVNKNTNCNEENGFLEKREINKKRIFLILLVAIIIMFAAICTTIIINKRNEANEIAAQKKNEISKIDSLYTQMDSLNFEIKNLEHYLGSHGGTIEVDKMYNLDTYSLYELKDISIELEQCVDKLNSNFMLLQEMYEINQETSSRQYNSEYIENNTKYPAGTVLYITPYGSCQGIRKSPRLDSDFACEENLYWGDRITLITDAVKDTDGNYWGEIDKGFIRIECQGEIWASTEIQY